MKTRQQVSITVLAATALCLIPTLANAQSTYRSDRNGNPVYDNNGSLDNNGRPGVDARLNGTIATRQQRVSAGSNVAFSYSVKNEGRDTRTYRFSSSRMFDLEAVRVDVGRDDRRGGNGNGRRIAWRYSDGQLGAQMLSEFTLRPGQTRSFTAQWQVDRNIPAGTYEVIGFLTPQRGGRIGLSTTRVIVENDRRNGNDRDDRPRRGNGNGNGGWNNGGNGNGRGNGRNEVLDVTDLVRSNNSSYANQRVTVRGNYAGNGTGRDSWLLDGTNIKAITVYGRAPRNVRLNDLVTVSGTLRRDRDGLLTLQAD